MRIFFGSRITATISLLAIFVNFIVFCNNGNNNKKVIAEDPAANSQDQYAGSESCKNCHKDIYQQYSTTAHFHTSATLAKGSHVLDGQQMVPFNHSTVVKVLQEDSLYYQALYVNGKQQIKQKLDISIGAGNTGKTYLSWRENHLVQLPLFYFAPTQQWVNSPGYGDKVVFNRLITPRCLECHASNVEFSQDITRGNIEFKPASLKVGINCEKCHGAAKQHIEFHETHPNDTTGGFTADVSHFTRIQKLDMCAICHGGSMNAIKPPFTFKAGDKLSNHYSYNTVATDVAALDVHGNQYGLLSMSECFNKSEMTCGSCHSAHNNERGQKALFSQRCMNCHTKADANFCTVQNVSQVLLVKNCIDCHMPEQPSKTIEFLEPLTNKTVSATMRSHLIKVYPGDSKKIMAYITKMSKK